jgi:hypothetical protein
MTATETDFEEGLRAGLTLQPGIGHNSAPLEQLLPEETAELALTAKLLVENASQARVANEETAQKATVLAGKMKDHLATIDKARDERMRPFLTATRTVNAHFNAIAGTLATVDGKGKIIGGPLFTVVGMVDEYRRKKEAEAAAERRRLEEEARRQREAAEAAERAQREAEERERLAAEAAVKRIREAEEAARNATNLAEREKARREAAEAEATRQREEHAARQRQMEAELEQRRRTEEADRLQRQAAATTASPITTAYGIKASRRTVWKVTITDMTAAIRHARKVNEAAVLTCVQTIFDAQVRAGVRSLPGAEITEDSSTAIRTR